MRTPYAENLPADGRSLARARPDEPPYGVSRRSAGLRKAAWILSGLLLLGLLIWAIKPSGQPASGRHGHLNANGPVPVGVAKAALSDVRVTLNALGAVTPLATVTVKPQVSGIMQKVDFREGRMVHPAMSWRKSTLAHTRRRSTRPKARWRAIRPSLPTLRSTSSDTSNSGRRTRFRSKSWRRRKPRCARTPEP